MSDEQRAIPLAAPAWRAAWEEYRRALGWIGSPDERMPELLEAAFAAGWRVGRATGQRDVEIYLEKVQEFQQRREDERLAAEMDGSLTNG